MSHRYVSDPDTRPSTSWAGVSWPVIRSHGRLGPPVGQAGRGARWSRAVQDAEDVEGAAYVAAVDEDEGQDRDADDDRADRVVR